MDTVLPQLTHYLIAGGWVVIVMAAILGLALNYAGLKIYWLLMFLTGMIPGLILGFAGGMAAGWGEAGAGLAALVCGSITGTLAIWLTVLAIFLLGGLVGATIAVALGAQEPVVLIIAGLICGGVFVGLHGLAIVVGTAFSGSAMLTYASLNAISIVRHGHPAWLPGNFLSYGARLGEAAWRDGGAGALNLLRGDILVFLVFFATGLIVQLNFHRIFGGAARAGAGAVKAGTGAAAGAGGRLLKPAPQALKPEAQKALPALAGAHGPMTWKISLFQEGQLLKSHLLVPGTFLLGREEGVDFLLQDRNVSRHHLEIILDDSGQLALRDVGSANGTWKLGTTRIENDTPVCGDWYQMGQAQVVFHTI